MYATYNPLLDVVYALYIALIATAIVALIKFIRMPFSESEMVTRLKEENEMLKRQIETFEKLLKAKENEVKEFQKLSPLAWILFLGVMTGKLKVTCAEHVPRDIQLPEVQILPDVLVDITNKHKIATLEELEKIYKGELE